MSSRALLLCCALLPLPAFAWGPVVEGGANLTLVRPQSLANFVGPVARAGMEIGERFNHALVFEFTQGNGYTLPTFDPHMLPDPSVSPRMIPVRVQTFAGRYTFSVDLLGKQGFTPSFGVGLALGTSTVAIADQLTNRFYLAFHAVAGARYTFAGGFGVRLDVGVSTDGGFIGVQPTAGVSYRF